MRRLLNGLYLFGGYAAAVLIALICVVVSIQVVFNLVDRVAALITGTAIGLTIPSYADFTGFFLAAASFLALAYTLRDGGHIRVTLFSGMISGKAHRVLEYICVGIAAAVSAYMSWYAVSLTMESLEYNDLSAGMIAVPIWIPQIAMALGLIILTIALIDELVVMLKGGSPSYEGKGENILGDTDRVSLENRTDV
jgi:TRAP-type C4-dicarboxylate transport system permease small subunit